MLNEWWRPIVRQSRPYVDLVGGIEGRCGLDIDIDGFCIAAGVARIRTVLAGYTPVVVVMMTMRLLLLPQRGERLLCAVKIVRA